VYLSDAADWAAFDAAVEDRTLADATTRELVVAAIARAFWRFTWPRIRDERLQVRVWILRPSVRVAALQPWFELVFGPAPAEVADA